MENTPTAVLAHTYSRNKYKTINVNGTPVGEIALDASVIGEYGVPVLFLSSDNIGCDEGRFFLPHIETVVTKTSYGNNCAFSKHPTVVEEEIERGVEKALNRLDTMTPFTFDKPVTIEIQLTSVLQTIKTLISNDGYHLSGPTTLKKQIKDMSNWQC